MCLILHKPAGKTFPREKILNQYKRNSDGFGYCYYDPQEDKIITKKTINMTAEQTADEVERLKDYEAIFHWRLKTHGEIVDEQCHPLKVVDKQSHGLDIWMAHNGIINIQGEVEDCAKPSDTLIFVERILKPILRMKPKLVRSEEFHFLVEGSIGSSKLAFMVGKGEVILINEDKGTEMHDCWVSNTTSFNTTTVYKGSYGGGSNSTGKKWGTNQQTKNSSTGVTNQGKSTTSTLITTGKFAGFPNKTFGLGDRVYIRSLQDKDYLVVGEVTALEATSTGKHVKVTFPNLFGVTVSQCFYPTTGMQVGYGTTEYRLFPRNDTKSSTDMGKLITDMQENDLSVKTEVEDTKKKVSSDSGTLKKIPTDPLSSPYWADEHLYVDYTSTSTGECVTVSDLYDMSDKDLEEFFYTNPELCFKVFKDTLRFAMFDVECYQQEEQEDYEDESYVTLKETRI